MGHQRITKFVFHHDGRVSVWWEGSDSMSDYFNMASRVSQKQALDWLRKDGSAPGAKVETTNYRYPDEEPDEVRRAKRFAARASLRYEDKVRPRRSADLGLLLPGPGLIALVAGGGALAWLLRGKGGSAGGAISSALAEGRKLWQQWGAMTKAQQQAAILQMVNQGIGDKRTALQDYANLWCGAFAAWIYRASVHPQLLLTSFASTLRLMALGQYQPTFFPYKSVMQGAKRVGLRDYHRAHGGERLYQEPAKQRKWAWAPAPGDIALVGGGKKNPEVPAHVTVVHDYNPTTGQLRAINGNGGGVDPKGAKTYGVVMTTFDAKDVKALVRLAPADFDRSLQYSKEAPTA